MSDLERLAATCVLQIALVAGLALVLLGRPGAHRGGGRLTVCEWSFAGLALLSLLTLTRPLWSDWLPPGVRPAAFFQTYASRPVATAAAETEPTPATAAEHVGVTWSRLASLGGRLAAQLATPPDRALWRRWRWWLIAPITAAVAAAAVRLTLAMWWLRRLRRASRSIDDAPLISELNELRRHYGVTTAVCVRESSALSQPVVIGWRRPTVLLPSGWRAWTAAERRLVLAHELAHVRRGDVRWRWLAEAVLAAHVYQPLVHWLHRRLVLEQELAADAAAAHVCGGAATYLRTLSALALRGDVRPGRALVAPVLTGLLLRRIEMLQTREGHAVSASPLGPWPSLTSLGLAIGLAWGLELPATAEGPAPAAQVVATSGARPQPEPADVFQRPSAPPLLVPHASGGLVEVRVREFFNGPAGKLLTPSLRVAMVGELADGLDQLLDDSGRAVWKAFVNAVQENQIESFAADMNAFFSYHPAAENGQRHRVGFGGRSLRLRLAAEQAWPKPSTEVREFRGVPYVTIPAGINAPNPEATAERPADAPSPAAPRPVPPLELCAAFPDPRTLVVVFGPAELPHVFPENPPALPAQVDRLRRAVGGGVATLVLPAAALKRERLTESDEPQDGTLDRLLSNVDVLALGVDVSADQRLAVRLRCGCQGREQAKAAEEALQSLLQAARDYVSRSAIVKVSGGESQPVDGGKSFLRELVAHARVTVEVHDDGAADLVLHTFGSRWFEVQ